MFSTQVRLLCFLLALPSLLGNPDVQRTRVEENLRGNSFGLENFLFQPYENADIVRVVKTKRIRPANLGQTYGLENAQLYESSRVKPTQEHVRRRPIEPTAESNRMRENFVVSPETVPEVTQEPEAVKPTERIRKKIMMRRRRKRPSSPTQSEGEITGNAILKPVRIPVYPQVSKVVFRTKSSDQGVVKSLPTAEIEVTEEAESQTTVTEKAVISTTKTAATTTSKPSTINLKTFLKQQTETLSLSELLQTQNLSLADLLRGNKDASAILRARQAITSTTPATIRRKQFTREQEKTEQTPKTVQVIEATTSRPNYNGFHPKIPRTKPNEEIASRPEESPKPVKRPSYGSPPSGSDPQNRLNELRTKLRNFQKKTSPLAPKTEVTSEPPARDEPIEPVSPTPNQPKSTEVPSLKKNRISFKSTNNPELSLIIPTKAKAEQENQKRPERLSNWTNRLLSIKRFGQDRPRQTEPPMTTLVSILEESSEEEPETTPKADEEIRKPEPKDELVELLKSGQNADRLQKILDSRNMTIEELLNNREKPPLQMDISALFSQQKKQTTAPPTLFDSLPDFNLDGTDRPASYDEPEAEESAPSVARVWPLPNREAKQFEFPVAVSPINLQTDDLTADRSNPEDTPLWKLSEKAIYYGGSYGYGEFPSMRQTEKPKPSESDIILLETIRMNQESNGKFKLDLKDFIREGDPQLEDIEKSYIPPAVKSAIIASGVVMGIALFVFIAIFAACGWKQRQVRLKSASSVLGGTLNKSEKSRRTLSPVSFKDTHSYKKTIDFDEDTSESGTSNTSSYLWSTLKNTFTSRASTLKSRMEKEEKVREDKVTLRRNESRRKESRTDDRPLSDDVYAVKKIDRDRNIINTSFNFKRSQTNNNFSHFNECVHGY